MEWNMIGTVFSQSSLLGPATCHQNPWTADELRAHNPTSINVQLMNYRSIFILGYPWNHPVAVFVFFVFFC